MGSICHGYKKEKWEILNEGNLKSNNKVAYNLKIGEWDDYCGRGHLSIWMTKEVYDKVMKDEYIVILQPYSEPPIIIKDKNDNIIDLLE